MRSTELERRSRDASIACIASIINACGAPQLNARTQHADAAPMPQMHKREGQNGAAVHLQAATCNTVQPLSSWRNGNIQLSTLLGVEKCWAVRDNETTAMHVNLSLEQVQW